MKVKGLVVLLAMVVAGAASASNEYDIKKYCKGVGDFSGGSSLIELGCRKQEEQARDSIPAKKASPKIAKYCDGVARTAGGSYLILAGCIDQEQQAQAQLDK